MANVKGVVDGVVKVGSKIKDAIPSLEKVSELNQNLLQFAEDLGNATQGVPGIGGAIGKEIKVSVGALKKLSGKGPEIVKDVINTAEKIIPKFEYKPYPTVVDNIDNTGISFADEGIELAKKVSDKATGSVEKIKGIFSSGKDKTVDFFKGLQEDLGKGYEAGKEAGAKIDTQKYLSKIKSTVNPAEWDKIRAFINANPKKSLSAIIAAGAGGAFATTDPDEFEDGTNIKQLSDNQISNWKAPVDSPYKEGGMSKAPNGDIKEGGISTKVPDDSKKIPGLEELKKQFPNLNVTTSIVDYMKARGMDSSFNNRSKLAKNFGIENYKGTPEQNISMFKKIMEESDPITM